ncbi:DUF2335 domain-containing protein [Acinetobacter guillouiae]|uniref:DUF2335 domain-containing protein n=1 Tax=Acinetobacter guillouiae TaxID=106649 RepID=UPI002FDA479F
MTGNDENLPHVNLDINIDPNQKVTPINTDRYAQHQIVEASFQSIKTPYLPPEFLESYEKTLPGSAREIFDLIHEQQKFEMELKRKEVDFVERNLLRSETVDAANIREQDSLNAARSREIDIKSKGQWFAFVSMILLLLASFGFSWLDKPIQSNTCLGLIVAMAAVMFLQRIIGHEKAEDVNKKDAES